MTDTNSGGQAGGQGGAANPQAGGEAQQTAPSINVLGQYIKDLSFENPNAPGAFQNQQNGKAPPLNVSVNVAAKTIGTDIEVELRIDARAGDDTQVMFNVELVYAGLFRVRGVPQEQMGPYVLIECPRILFPFARQIVAETISNGGFPPLMLDPIDFVALYRQRLAQQKQQNEAAQPPAGGNA